MAVVDLEAKERAFLDEFHQWWPFAKKHLNKGGRVVFSITLEMTRPGRYFVKGAIDCSSKLSDEAKREERAA